MYPEFIRTTGDKYINPTIRTTTIADPAANTELSATVTTAKLWIVLAMNFTFVTDANAANRQVRVVMDDGTTVFFRTGTNVNHTASTTFRYTAAPFGSHGAISGSDLNMNLPLIPLPAGYRIYTSTVSIQATDNFGAAQLHLVEYSKVA